MSLGDFGRDMLAEAARIAQQTVAREGTHLRWATVTEADPLRIRYDGEPNQSIVTPQTTVAGLQVGDRVAVAKQHGQALIVGRAGGVPVISGTGTLATGFTGTASWVKDGNWVHINYDITGTNTGDTLGATFSTLPVNLPFTPASEYTYGDWGLRPTYAENKTIRFPSQPGVTRRRGTITCRV